VTKNADPFLKSFLNLYQNNKEVRNSLLVALMHAFCFKLDGINNPNFAPIAMNFFIACDAMSRKTSDFLSANFLGPCLRTIQRHNSKEREELFITANESNIHSRLKHYLVRLAADGIRASISIGFDGTKVPPVLTLSTLHRAIIGGATPHHFISVDDLTEEQVKSKLDKQSDIIRADEIKVAVISIQNVKKKKCPFFVLAGQPQTVNMPSSFNEFVTQACLSVCNELKEADLVSVAADGVGCDNKWVCQQLRGFLRGDNRHVGLIDTDHNAKNFRYQLLGGSSVVMMGNFIIDPELLRLARVEIDLW